MVRVCLTSLLFSLFFLGGGTFAFQDEKELKQEEAEDHFRKWLNEDVLFIISSDERAVFRALTTPEEKEQFIEQFWFRRDPDPRTSENEYKEEHYNRIDYANKFLGRDTFLPGWRTADA